MRHPSETGASRPGAVLLIHGLRVRRDPMVGWLQACALEVARTGAVPLAFTYPQWAGWSAFAWMAPTASKAPTTQSRSTRGPPRPTLAAGGRHG